MITFNCNCCGKCCKLIGYTIDSAKLNNSIILTRDEIINFPYSINPDGSCSMLNADNQCKVYDTRPDICRVDRTYEKHYKEIVTREVYYSISAACCDIFNSFIP